MLAAMVVLAAGVGSACSRDAGGGGAAATGPAPTTAPAATPEATGWRTAAPSPVTRYEGQGAVVDGRLFALGGYTTCCRPAATTASHVYDPVADTWDAIADMPEPITHAGTAVVGDEIVLAGGFVGDSPGAATDEVWRYDTVGDAWERGVDLPAPRGGGALVAHGTDLHFLGGGGPGGGELIAEDHADHWVLADGADEWVARAPVPNPRNHMAGVELGGLIYAVGGQHLDDEGAGNQDTVEVYDPATGAWTAGPPLPQPTGHISASTFVRDGRIVVAGGKSQGFRLVPEVWELDPAAGEWTALPPLPRGMQSPLAGGVGDAIVVTTGGGGGIIRDDTYILGDPAAAPPATDEPEATGVPAPS